MRRHVGGWAAVVLPALAPVVLLLTVALLLAAAGPASSSPVGTTGTTTPSPSDTGTPTATPTPTATSTDTPTPTATATAPADSLLRPDLRALPASRPTVRERKDGLRLRFTSSLANVGIGPMEVRPNRNKPCPPNQHNATQVIYRDVNANGLYNRRIDTEVLRHRAGCMIFHPLHDHWHFKATARYTLLDPSQDGQVVISARRKVSFCLRDSARVPERLGEWPYAEAYGRCARRTPQGISIGWMDVYERALAGQSLRLPDQLRPGVYCLETVVDPLDELIETNDANNRSMRALSIRGTRVERRDTALCR